MSPKRFVIAVLASSALAFATFAATNFVVNPYAQYPTEFVAPLVHTSRSIKVAALSHYDPPPDGLILGSSRILKFEPKYLASKLDCDSFFNAGVYFGKPEDNLAFLRLYRQRFGRMPKTVVIGLDVHGFNDGLTTDARLLNNRQLVQQIDEAISFSDRFQSIKALVSWEQTKSSARSIVRVLTSRDIGALAESFQADGLIDYREREEQIANGTYDFSAALEYNKREYKHLFEGYAKLSSKRIELFTKVVSECNRAGARVIVLLTPAHPLLIDHLSNTTTYFERRDELVDMLNRQAKSHHFTFFDFSDIKSFDGDPSQFVDGIHPLEFNTRLMIDQLSERATK